MYTGDDVFVFLLCTLLLSIPFGFVLGKLYEVYSNPKPDDSLRDRWVKLDFATLCYHDETGKVIASVIYRHGSGWGVCAGPAYGFDPFYNRERYGDKTSAMIAAEGIIKSST